jgi:hypothetical protein
MCDTVKYFLVQKFYKKEIQVTSSFTKKKMQKRFISVHYQNYPETSSPHRL